MKVPQSYFDNRKEQAEIRDAIWDAIPTDISYRNLLLAINDIQRTVTKDMFKAMDEEKNEKKAGE